MAAGNPLAHFHLWDDIDRYEAAQTDEQLADFFHRMLAKYEHRPLVVSFIHAMITFSVGGTKINPEALLR